MKFESSRVITWYAAALGVAAGAALFAYLGAGPALMGTLVFAAVSYASLTAVSRAADDTVYEKVSEVLAATGMVVFLPLIFLAHFLTALMVFLGFAQLALNFQTHDYRRFYVGMAVSFVALCAGATEAKSGFYLIFFLAYTISASMAIGYAYMAQRQSVKSGRWDLGDRAWVCSLLICLAICVYLLMPRLPAGALLSQPGSDHFYRDKSWEAEARKNKAADAFDKIEALRQASHDAQHSGQAEDHPYEDPASDSETVQSDRLGGFHYQGFEKELDINNPDENGHRFSNRIVARMRADLPQYLRIRIFDEFDGLRWRSSSDQMVKLGVGYDGVELVPPNSDPSSRLQRYEVFIEHHLGDYIPAAAVPVNLNFPATAIGMDVFGQLHSPGTLKKGTVYSVTSQYNLQQGRLFAELDHQPWPAYTRLPRDLDPRIAALAGRVAQGATTQMAAAIALEQHLRTGYQYDLQSAFTSQAVTPLSEFLFESRSGHCEYFASALAVMLRTQQIPSRLVTGFSATNQNPLTGYYDIYALDGHAWVEAFVDGRGWLILEPTAYYDGPLSMPQELSAQQINAYVERQIRRRNALGLDRFSATRLINAAWQLFYVIASAALAYVKWFVLKYWPWMILLVPMGVGAWLAWRQYKHVWLAFRLQRKVARYTTDQPRQAVEFYLHAIESLLRLAGFRIPAGCTIERYLAHLASMGVVREEVDLAAAFNEIFYNDQAPGQEVMQGYRQLFQLLYEFDMRDLRSRAMNHPQFGPMAD